MVNRKKLVGSQRLAQRRTKQKIKSAEQRIAEYRALVSAEGIESQRLAAIDTAKEAYRSRSARAANEISHSVDIKKSQRNRKKWHYQQNAMRREWKGIYQGMQSNYTSATDNHLGSDSSVRLRKENYFPKEKMEGGPAKPKRKSQYRLTVKGQPIMCERIAEIYGKCTPLPGK